MKITSTILRLQLDDDGVYTGLVEQPGNAQRLVYLTGEKTYSDAFADVARQHAAHLGESG
jgi:hypothetical protein